MRLLGLTGGIGSGKSTVGRMFSDHGLKVVDADAVYHELLVPAASGEPSAVVSAIGALFPGVVRPDGTLDRPMVGERVFGDEAARKRLNEIAHPAVAKATQAKFAALAASGAEVAVYEVPLLYENRLETAMQGVIVVWVPEALQLTRMRARDGISEAAAQRRLAAQMPLEHKRQRATYVIDNSGDLAETAAQVRALVPTLRASIEPGR